MDSPSEIREFLITRRARLTPEQAGLPDFGGRRRVDGLRREEVALIAGISVEYYTRLERGNAAGVSEAVLDGISRALQLDDAEHAHLHDLVRAATLSPGAARRRSPAKVGQVPPSVRRMIDAMKDVAVLIQNGRGDVVAANRLGEALYIRDVRATATSSELRTFRVSRPSVSRLLPRLGRGGPPDRGNATQ